MTTAVYVYDEDGHATRLPGVISADFRAVFDDEKMVVWDTRPVLQRPISREFTAGFKVPPDAWQFWSNLFRIPLRVLVGPVPYKPSKRRYGR